MAARSDREGLGEIVTILKTPRQPKYLLIAAIGAAGFIRPAEAEDILAKFTDSDDEDIAEAAEEAIMMASAEFEFGDEEFDDEDEDEDGRLN